MSITLLQGCFLLSGLDTAANWRPCRVTMSALTQNVSGRQKASGATTMQATMSLVTRPLFRACQGVTPLWRSQRGREVKSPFSLGTKQPYCAVWAPFSSYSNSMNKVQKKCLVSQAGLAEQPIYCPAKPVPSSELIQMESDYAAHKYVHLVSIPVKY